MISDTKVGKIVRFESLEVQKNHKIGTCRR